MGDIKLKIDIDVTDAEATISGFNKSVDTAFNSSSAKVQSFGRSLDRVTSQIAQTRDKLNSLAVVRKPTNALESLDKGIKSIQHELSLAQKEYGKLLAGGAKPGTSAVAMEEKAIIRLRDELIQALSVKKQLIESGKAYTFRDNTQSAEYQNTLRTYQNLVNQGNFLNSQIQGMSKNTSNLGNMFMGLYSKGTKAVTSIASSFLNKLKPSIEKTADAHNMSFKKMLTMVLKYAFGIRSVFLLYKKVRTEIKNGMKSLASDFPEIQAQVDALSSSWWAFKSSITSAFQPIFSYVVPALITLINYLTSAMNALANFFALLTGQGFYYKAVKGNNKVAKSIGGAGKAAKDAALDIAEYDKLLVIHKDDNGGGGGGGGGAGDSDMYNWKKVDTTANSLVEKLKNMWGVFKQAWEDKGQDVIKAFKYALQSIKALIVDIGNTFYKVFMEGYGYNWIISVLGILEQMLLLVGDIATAFKEAWDRNENGYKLIVAIFNTATKINNLIIALTKSLRNAWNENKLGVRIIENILQIVTNIINIVGNLAERFKEAWEKNEVGKRIFQDILGVINIVLTTVNDITKAIEKWSSSIDFYPLLESVEGMLDKIKTVVQDVCDIAKEIYEDYVEPLCTKLIEEWLPKIIDMVTQFLQEIDPTLKDIKNMLKEIKPIMDLIADPLFSAWIFDMTQKLNGLNAVIRVITNAITVTAKQFNLFVAAFKSALAYLNVQGNMMGNAIKNIFTTAWNIVKNQPLMQLGKYIWDGIKNGFKEKNPIEVIKELFRRFKEGFAQIFGIHSPATKMEPFGKNILLGILNGFTKAFGKIQTAVTKFKNKLGSLLTKGLDIAVNFITNLKGVVTSITGLDNLKTKFTNMYNAFRSRTATMTTNMAGVATKIADLTDVKDKFQALRDGWNGAKAKFETSVGGAIKNINELSTNKDSWLSKFTKLHNNWKDGSAKFSVASIFNGAKQGIDTLQKGDDSWLGKFNKLYKGWNNKNASANFNFSSNTNTSSIDAYASSMSSLQSQWHDSSATLTMKTSFDYWSTVETAIKIKAELVRQLGAKIARASGLNVGAIGGIFTPQGVTRFANGGVIANGISRLWNSIPKFANGGAMHGSLFVAGEAGPELLGHIGNRTEVLNKSQLASVMLHAVKEGMLSAIGSIKGLSIGLDLNSLTQIPIPVIVQGQVLPVNEAFMTKFDDNTKALSNIETMLQSLMGRQDSPQAHQPIQVTIDGKVVAEVVWSEQEKKYKQSGKYNARYV